MNENETTTSTSLTTKPKMPSFKRGIAATRFENEQKLKEVKPSEVPNRLGIIFDDSSSMSGEKIEDAYVAIRNFTNSCNQLDTSIAFYPMNASPRDLTIDYDVLNMYVQSIGASGGTPLYTKLRELIENVEITRAVVFSDGDPTDSRLINNNAEGSTGFSNYGAKSIEFARDTVKLYIDKEIPVDAIYISEKEGDTVGLGYDEMKKLAELTSGVFIHFKDSKSLSQNLKYLAPKYRALLVNAYLKAMIEKGEKI
jgi:hypothetical protein